VDKAFDKWWPDLKKELEAASKAVEGEVAPPKRGADEMIEEVLELVRAMTPQILGLARDVQLERRTREFMATWAAPLGKLKDMKASPGGSTADHAEAVAPESKSNAAFYGEQKQ
jgi:hypothetical protein